MGQRLGVAAALLGQPQTVVLDEPVNGLDPDGVRWIRLLLKSLAAEGTDLLRVSGATAEQIGTAAWQAHVPVFELTPAHASLEEAFMQVTQDSIEYHSATGSRPSCSPTNPG